MDIFALLLQNLEKSLVADKKQKSTAAHPELFDNFLQKSLEQTFSQKITPKVQPALTTETFAKRPLSIFTPSQQTRMPIQEVQKTQIPQVHETRAQAKSASVHVANPMHPKSDVKELKSHLFMVNIPAKSRALQKEAHKEAHTNTFMQPPKRLHKKIHDKEGVVDTLSKSAKKSHAPQPSTRSQNAEPLAQYVAIAAELPPRPTTATSQTIGKEARKRDRHHTESVHKSATQASKSPTTHIKNHRPHDFASLPQRSTSQPKVQQSWQRVQPSVGPKSESIFPHLMQNDTTPSQEAKQPRHTQQSVLPHTKMLQAPQEGGNAASKHMEMGYALQQNEKSGLATPSTQQAAPITHKDSSLQNTGHKQPRHARYIEKNVSVAKSEETHIPHRHTSAEESQPLVSTHDAPKEVQLRDESVVTLSQSKHATQTQEQPQNMAQQHTHSFDSGESFEMHQVDAPTHMTDEQAFEQLRRHEVRTIQLRLDQTLVNVTMHQRQLSLNFVSSQSMQLEGNIAEVVDAIMQESGYERYKVTLRDRERRITIDSKGRDTIRSETRSGVNVKV